MIQPRKLVLLLIALALTGEAAGQAPVGAVDDPLARGFREPPNSALPRAWWQWMNGNITLDGIERDLKWMRRVGFGGVQVFDVSVMVPQLVEDRVAFGTPQWRKALRHAAALADELGLEMGVAASPGWSETGGPWVKPEQAMKKVVWAETRLTGPGRLPRSLAAPPSVSGPFQDIAIGRSELPMMKVAGARPEPQLEAAPVPSLYRDIKVLAFRAPLGDVPATSLKVKVTSNGGSVNAGMLTDGDLTKRQTLKGAAHDAPIWIRYEFEEPATIHAFFFAVGNGGMFGTTSIPDGRIEASTDGETFRTLVTLPGQYATSAPTRTFSFPATKARVFRIVFTSVPPNPLSIFGATSHSRYEIAELRFETGARVNRFEEKAGYGTLHEYETERTPAVAASAAIPASEVIDLTAKLKPDGSLDWNAPAGEWIVLRLGCSLTGKPNAPATREGRGLEVDKLSRKHVRSYLHAYLDPILAAVEPHAGERGLRTVLADSWEAGQANWTDEMLQEFTARRGYDPTPWLPALTGRIVTSADATDRFLRDYRRTIADLVAENHYGVIQEYLRERGLTFYGEATGVKLHTVSDGLQAKSYTDVPVGEFWGVPFGASPAPEHVSDIREAASAAHVYGKKLVAAESFTIFPARLDPWAISPWHLKWIADRYLTLGVNQFLISSSVHQPFEDRRPGITLGPFGQHFTRNHTWAELAGPWLSYLARSSYMLQQGRSVADIAYFYGEGAPVSAPYGERPKPEIPAGYAYDYVSADAIVRLMSVRDGRIVTPSGQSYRLLVLPDSLDRMTLPVLKKIAELVAAGAIVVGPKPSASPSLSDSDAQISALANALWGGANGRAVQRNTYDKGLVFWGPTPAEVLAAKGVRADVDYTRPSLDTRLLWTHRVDADADIYFIANHSPRRESLEVSFRVTGKAAERWDPDSGAIEPTSYRVHEDATLVPLQLDPYGSTFIVFRKPAAASEVALPEPAEVQLSTLDGAWDVAFPSGWGAPPRIRMERLTSWSARAEEGVRYFSGTATYSRQLDAPASWLRAGTRLMLDLGEVKDIAKVFVNGAEVGVLWKPPFRIDIARALKPGANELRIEVTNNWINRMIGDARGAGDRRYTFVTSPPYTSQTPLAPSGLLGPVRIIAVTTAE